MTPGSDPTSGPSRQRETVTQIINSRATHPEALADLAPIVYDELRMIASRALRNEADGHTLQTTDLVHEAFLRLVRAEEVSIRGRSHFFALCAKVMRQILVDHAKSRGAAKRGRGERPVSLDDVDVVAPAGALSPADLADLVTLDSALERLTDLSPRQARVVECRFFGGMNVDETAEALDISRATVKRDWAVARAWLNHAMAGTRPR